MQFALECWMWSGLPAAVASAIAFVRVAISGLARSHKGEDAGALLATLPQSS